LTGGWPASILVVVVDDDDDDVGAKLPASLPSNDSFDFAPNKPGTARTTQG
jgi:hypothetical protein